MNIMHVLLKAMDFVIILMRSMVFYSIQRIYSIASHLLVLANNYQIFWNVVVNLLDALLGQLSVFKYMFLTYSSINLEYDYIEKWKILGQKLKLHVYTISITHCFIKPITLCTQILRMKSFANIYNLLRQPKQ